MIKLTELFSEPELKDWRARLEKHPEANLLQSPEWAHVNAIKGAKVFYLPFGENDFALAILRTARRGRYLEVPAGPIIDWHNDKTINTAFDELKKLARSEKCGFIRFRPQLEDTPENRKKTARSGGKLSLMHLGAQNTVFIDLKPTEDEILASLRRQTRYEVRQSAKKGVVVEKYTSLEMFKEFHQVQVQTAERQHFIPPNFTELEAEHEAFGENAVIYKAMSAEGEPIAYGLVLKGQTEAEYFEAASTDLGRKLPGAYAIQWQAIRDLKAEGYDRYNLFGIAPPNQPNHRYAKVTTFKTGFGEPYNFVPAHDIVISSVKYGVNRLIEAARKKKRHL
ncbi:MAG: peptidoglycan bridge formation glycyltransferase FemA/FemB family protein [Candidatus Saccharibacteria bacterium]|nr:peptidoglycan bridge formation glycyltransferase FemA/FemB family protein [Candidatus Saccharibacteria bacterium]